MMAMAMARVRPAAHGVDLGDARSDLQHLSTETGRVRAHFPLARRKGLSLSLLTPLAVEHGN